jgi:predicted ATPase
LPIDARFTLEDDNAPDVAEIARRTDGIPLAIELAVPWLRVLSVRELSERLADRFRILVGGNRNAQPRHRTLEALIAWSYEGLSAAERGVFCGGGDVSWKLFARRDRGCFG